MAITVTWDGYGKVSDIDSTTGVSVIKATSGGGTPSPALADGGLQGASAAQAVATTTNGKLILLYYDLGSGNEIDMAPRSTQIITAGTGLKSYNFKEGDYAAQSFYISTAYPCYITSVQFTGDNNINIVGSPVQLIQMDIVKDNVGFPSTDPDDVIATSHPVLFDETAGTTMEGELEFQMQGYTEKLQTSPLYWLVIRCIKSYADDASNYIQIGSYLTGTVPVLGNFNFNGTNYGSERMRCRIKQGGEYFGEKIWVWGNMLASTLLQTQDGQGMGVMIGENSGGTVYWNLYNFYGSDNYAGGWVRMVVDPTSTPAAYHGSGSTGATEGGSSFTDLSSIRYIGMFAYTASTARFENMQLDRIDVGNGYTITGTTIANLVDEILTEEESVANWWGNVRRLDKNGVSVALLGDLTLGDSSGTNAATLEAKNSIISIDTPKAYTWQYAEEATNFNYCLSQLNRIKVEGNGTGATSLTVGTKVGTGNDATGVSGITMINGLQDEYPILRNYVSGGTPITAPNMTSTSVEFDYIVSKAVINPDYDLSRVVIYMESTGSPDATLTFDVHPDNGSARQDQTLEYYTASKAMTSISPPGGSSGIGVEFILSRGADWVPYEEWPELLHFRLYASTVTTLNGSNYYTVGRNGESPYWFLGDYHIGQPIITFATIDSGTNWTNHGCNFSLSQKFGQSARVSLDDGNVNTCKLYGAKIKGFQIVGSGTNTAHEFMGSTLDYSRATLGSIVIRNCNFINYQGLKAAFGWQSGTDIQNSSFISNERGIEHDTEGTFGYTGLTFSGNTDDINNSSVYENQTVEDQQTASNTSYTIGAGVTYQGGGHVFQMGTTTTQVTGCRFYLDATAGVATLPDMTISIYNITGTPGTNATPTGAAIYSQTYSYNDILTTTVGNYDFAFTTGPILTGSTYYALEIKFLDATETLTAYESTVAVNSGNHFRYQTSGGWTVISGSRKGRFAVFSEGNVIINATDSNPATSINTNGNTTTINNSVNATVTVIGVDKAPIQNAQVSIHLNPDDAGSEVLNADTNASGVALAAYNYAGDVPIIVKVRKSETTDTPRYKPFSVTGTITSDGYSRTVTLVENTKLS